MALRLSGELPFTPVPWHKGDQGRTRFGSLGSSQAKGAPLPPAGSVPCGDEPFWRPRSRKKEPFTSAAACLGGHLGGGGGNAGGALGFEVRPPDLYLKDKARRPIPVVQGGWARPVSRGKPRATFLDEGPGSAPAAVDPPLPGFGGAAPSRGGRAVRDSGSRPGSRAGAAGGVPTGGLPPGQAAPWGGGGGGEPAGGRGEAAATRSLSSSSLPGCPPQPEQALLAARLGGGAGARATAAAGGGPPPLQQPLGPGVGADREPGLQQWARPSSRGERRHRRDRGGRREPPHGAAAPSEEAQLWPAAAALPDSGCGRPRGPSPEGPGGGLLPDPRPCAWQQASAPAAASPAGSADGPCTLEDMDDDVPEAGPLPAFRGRFSKPRCATPGEAPRPPAKAPLARTSQVAAAEAPAHRRPPGAGRADGRQGARSHSTATAAAASPARPEAGGPLAPAALGRLGEQQPRRRAAPRPQGPGRPPEAARPPHPRADEGAPAAAEDNSRRARPDSARQRPGRFESSLGREFLELFAPA